MSTWRELYLQKSERGHRFIQAEMKMLTFIGIIIPGNCKARALVMFLIYRCLILCLGFSILITCIGDLFASKGDLVLIGDDLCVIIGIGLVLFKYIIFLIKYEDMKDIVDKILLISIKDEPNHERRKYLHLQDNYAILGISVAASFHALSIVVFVVFVFVAPESDSLPLRALFPFDFKQPYLFELMYFYQGLGIFFILATILTIDNSTGYCWHQISCNFLILGEEFKDMEEYCTNENVEVKLSMNCKMIKRLRILIMRHQFIIRLAEQLNDLTNPMLSAQVLASNFLLCLTGFEMTLSFENKSVFLKFFVYMCSAVGQLLFWCIYGNEIQTCSETIVTMAYLNSSVCIDKTFLQQLKIVIMRAQRPIQMRASSIFSLCLESFLSILRKSYSYFAVLRTLNESPN